MVSHPLTNWWDYEPVTVRCPCKQVMPADEAQEHAFNHWDDLPKEG